MLNSKAETSFQRGLELLHRGSIRDALPFLRAALELDQRDPSTGDGQARYLSYYGLSLSLCSKRHHDAIKMCRRAVEMEGFRPEAWWNLGRVALAAGRRAEAYRAFQHGLAVHPGHRGLVRELRHMGVRREPVVSFLPRTNPINVALGRLRPSTGPSRQQPVRSSLATG